MGRSVIGPELTEGVEDHMFAQKRILEYMMLQLRSRKYASARSLRLTISLMGNRRVMFECHKQRGLMHSLGCSGAEGPHNIIFAPLRAKLESKWGGGRQAASLARQ